MSERYDEPHWLIVLAVTGVTGCLLAVAWVLWGR